MGRSITNLINNSPSKHNFSPNAAVSPSKRVISARLFSPLRSQPSADASSPPQSETTANLQESPAAAVRRPLAAMAPSPTANLPNYVRDGGGLRRSVAASAEKPARKPDWLTLYSRSLEKKPADCDSGGGGGKSTRTKAAKSRKKL